jgi:uncharacterized protein YdiU (UPF0061 family)
MTKFSQIELQPSFSKELPVDPNPQNFSRQVRNTCLSFVDSKVPVNPELVHLSNELLTELDLQIDDEKELILMLSGAKSFKGFKSYAMCYGGHQFGNWAGQLGDGRAINIAEVNIKGSNWKFQLKGSGPTPYSRNSDGLAVLRSSIREYLCSEAMFHLGVPTTRALSLIKTGERVVRDILYSGNPQKEDGAVVCRISPSFIRFGSFEILAARGEVDNLRKLVDHTIVNHYPHLGEPSKETYLKFYAEVVNRTKKMIVDWQRVGFVHGVMNTDNMSILGSTIDYGPYGWLEDYNPSWTPNTTDAQHKRYRFGNQANISLWNLTQLANAIYPLIEEAEPLQDILNVYQKNYLGDYHNMMLSKLGLYNVDGINESFISELTDLLEVSTIDMTMFFRLISNENVSDFKTFYSILIKSSYQSEEALKLQKELWQSWQITYVTNLANEKLESSVRLDNMKLVNPKYVLRNYMAQLAIEDAEKGDYKLVDDLYQLLLNPYAEQPENEKWFAKRPEWADNKAGCSMLSCSS